MKFTGFIIVCSILATSSIVVLASENNRMTKTITHLTETNRLLGKELKKVGREVMILNHEKTHGVDPLWAPEEVDAVSGADVPSLGE